MRCVSRERLCRSLLYLWRVLIVALVNAVMLVMLLRAPFGKKRPAGENPTGRFPVLYIVLHGCRAAASGQACSSAISAACFFINLWCTIR